MRTPYLYFGLLALLILPAIALAQEFTSLTNLPGVADASGADSLPTFFNNLYKLCIGAAAVIAVIQIMRAGMYFMFNKGSVAHNEKAKGLISNAILGLLLVLSPTIIFGIINPDILSLKLDLKDIKIENPKPTPAGTSASTATPTECSTKYEGIQAGADYQQCKASKGFVSIPKACCAKEAAICCGKPKGSTEAAPAKPTPSTPAPEPVTYMWRMAFEKPDGGGRHTEQGGPFPTQQQCTASFSSFIAQHQSGSNALVVSDAEPQCTCNQPRSTFPGCRN